MSTQADRIRAYAAAHPELTSGEVAAALGLDRRAAWKTLQASPRRGRPPATVRQVTLTVPLALLPYASARMQGGDDGLASVLLAAAEAELVPESEWSTYVEACGIIRKTSPPKKKGPRRKKSSKKR